MTWRQPPAGYRWEIQQLEREAGRHAQREADAARAEQAAAREREEAEQVQELQRRFSALPTERQAEMDQAARRAIAQRPMGTAWPIPPTPDVWAAKGPGPAIYCGEIARLIAGIPAAE